MQATEADRLQAEAQLAAVQSTYERMKKAAETPGAIAGNEVIQAEKQVDSAKALLNSRQQAIKAVEAAVRSLKDLHEYLKISAPFEGVVTDRIFIGVLLVTCAGRLAVGQEIAGETTRRASA